MRSFELDIQGMSCVNCAQGIERALRKVDGVTGASVNFATATAVVEGGDHVEETALVQAVKNAGYNVGKQEHGHTHEKWRFLLAALFSIPLLLPMFGIAVSGWVQLFCASVVQFGPGWSFYRGAFHSLRAGSANMDLLIALGISAAYGLSIYYLYYGGHLYFESSALITTLVLMGRWLESLSKHNAS